MPAPEMQLRKAVMCLLRRMHGFVFGLWVCGMSSLFLTSVCNLSMPVVLAAAVNELPAAGGLSPRVAAMAASLFVFGGMSSYLRVRCLASVAAALQCQLTEEVYEAAMDQGLDLLQTGTSITQLLTDAEDAADGISGGLVAPAIRSINTVVGNLLLLFLLSPRLSVLTMGSVVAIVATGSGFGRYKKRMLRRTREAAEVIKEEALEKMSNLSSAQFVGLQPIALRQMRSLVAEMRSAGNASASASGLFMGALAAVLYVVLILLFKTASRMVQSQLLTLGDLAAFGIRTAFLLLGLNGIVQILADSSKFVLAVAAIENSLEAMRRSHPPPGRLVTWKSPPLIQIKNVSFAYPEASDSPVLSDLSFTVLPGEVILLQGPNGCGKSTLLTLIAGLRQPTKGSILLSGLPVTSFDARDLRRRGIAVVEQNPVLFSGSVRDNVHFGNMEATMDDVDRVIFQVNLLSVMSGLPNGLETRITRGGISLSAGQVQRIAVARGLLKDTPVVCLDEPTSAMDKEAVENLVDIIEQLRKLRRTVLVVSHDPRVASVVDKTVQIMNDNR